MLMSIYNVSPKVDLISVTFDPETAEIRLLIVTDRQTHRQTHRYYFY